MITELQMVIIFLAFDTKIGIIIIIQTNPRIIYFIPNVTKVN